VLCGRPVWLVIVVSCSVQQVCVVSNCFRLVLCDRPLWLVIVLSCSVLQISEFTGCITSGQLELQAFLFVQIHPWVNFESLLQKCLVGQLVQSSRSTGSQRVVNKTTSFITKLFTKRGRTSPCCAVCMRVVCYPSILICSFQLAFTNVCCSTLATSTVHDNCGKH
jgi:hypothetical protein